MGLLAQCIDLLGHLACKMAGMQHAARGVRTRGHRIGRAQQDRHPRIFQGCQARQTNTCQRHHFAGGCAQLTMHHHAVVGRKLVGRRGTCGQAGHVLQREGICPCTTRQTTHSLGGQLCIGMRRQAGMPIKRIKPLPNAVAAQNNGARPRRPAARHAQHRFDLVVMHRLIRQKARSLNNISGRLCGLWINHLSYCRLLRPKEPHSWLAAWPGAHAARACKSAAATG